MATLLPNGKQVFLDGNGVPVAAGTVTFYVPGTSTLKATYQDGAATILNTNPVVLDAAGSATIYGNGVYRQVVKDVLGNLIWDQLTSDTSVNISSWGGTSTGSPNAQNVAVPNFSSQDGQAIDFIAGYTNTGPLTINGIPVDIDGASGPAALTGGEVATGNVYHAVYDLHAGVLHINSPLTRKIIPTLGDITAKLLVGGSATIAFEGDSHTYGQDLTSATGNQPAINGSSTLRSVTPYPESFLFAAQTMGFLGLSVVNRGYPGDTSADGLTRWASVPVVDFCFLMFGTNDAALVAGSTTVTRQSVAQYRANMIQLIERRLNAGTGVGILLCGPIQDSLWDSRSRAYATVAKHLAAQYGLLCFDTGQALNGMLENNAQTMWTDGLHYSSYYYNEIGFSLATFLAAAGEEMPEVGPGTILYAEERLGYALSNLGASYISRFEGIRVAANGGVIVLAFDVKVACYAVIEMVNNSPGIIRNVVCYHSGEGTRSGDPNIVVYSDGYTSIYQSTQVHKLQAGKRNLILKNYDPTNDAFVSKVAFVNNSYAHGVRGIQRSTSLAGRRTPRFLAGTDTAWGLADYDCKLNIGYQMHYSVIWDGTNQNGFSLVQDRSEAGLLLSNNLLVFLRSGRNVIARTYVAGISTDIATFANVFADTNPYIGDFLWGGDGTNAYINVNGGSYSVADHGFNSGYPGIAALAGVSTAILAAAIQQRTP